MLMAEAKLYMEQIGRTLNNFIEKQSGTKIKIVKTNLLITENKNTTLTDNNVVRAAITISYMLQWC